MAQRDGCAGLGALGDRLSSVKTYLQSQIRALTTKQDQTIAAQGAMQEHLNVVGRDVEETRCEVSEVLPPPSPPPPSPRCRECCSCCLPSRHIMAAFPAYRQAATLLCLLSAAFSQGIAT